jgi:hypothetical protein
MTPVAALLTGADEREKLRERLPALIGRRRAPELVDRRARLGAELVITPLVARAANDPEALGHQSGLPQMKQAGNQLPLREIAGCTKKDNQVIVRRRRRRWGG